MIILECVVVKFIWRFVKYPMTLNIKNGEHGETRLLLRLQPVLTGKKAMRLEK